MAIENLRQIKKTQYVYYDPRLLEEDMPEANAHRLLLHYLTPLLTWVFRDKDWYVISNTEVSRKTEQLSIRIAPDIAVFKGVDLSDQTIPFLQSWKVGEPNRPTPSVVFEVASKKTWQTDLGSKVQDYRELGVREYFAYDPNTPPYWATNGLRLRGWQYTNEQTKILTPDERGWIWSAELESWLKPDGLLLQLCDADGKQRLTQAQEETRARLEAERKLAEALAKLQQLG